MKRTGKTKNKSLSLSEQVRQAIETCGVSRYRLAKELGLSQSMLSRVVSGERELSCKAIEALCEHLGLQIEVRPKAGAKALAEQL